MELFELETSKFCDSAGRVCQEQNTFRLHQDFCRGRSDLKLNRHAPTLPFIILCLCLSDLHDFNDDTFFSIRCDEMQRSHSNKDKRVVMALTHFIAKLSLRICILIKVRDLEDKRLLRIHALVITCLPITLYVLRLS